MNGTKLYWVGQRMLDGVIYAEILPTLDTIFCCDTCDITEELEQRLKIYSLERLLKKKQDWVSYSIDLIFKQFSNEISNCDSQGYQMFPYALPSYLDHLAKSNTIINWRVVSYNLSRAVQRALLSNSGLSVPPWMAVDNETGWDLICSQLGGEIVLQYDETSSGHGTFLIGSKEQFDLVKEHMNRSPAIANTYIPSIPISCHVLVSPDKISTSLPSIQIIEENISDDVTSLRYCGNDFGSYNHFSEKQKQLCEDAQIKVGEVLRTIGVRGLLGVDLLVTEDDVLINEINFRLQNSTPLYTLIENGNGGEPLIRRMIYHTQPLVEGTPGVNAIHGAQYILRAQDTTIGNLTSGIYNQNGELLRKDTSIFSSLSHGEYQVVLEYGRTITEISKGAEIAKIYSLDPIIQSDGTKSRTFTEFLERLSWT